MNPATPPSSTSPITPTKALGPILVPVDCEHRSKFLLRGAATLAHRMGARLALLYVYPPLTSSPAHSSAKQFHALHEYRQREAGAKLAEFQSELSDHPEIRAAQILAVGGFPEDKILTVAQELDAEMIVVSTHGYCGLKHFLAGSKAEWLVRHAHCPILVLPSASQEVENPAALIAAGR